MIDAVAIEAAAESFARETDRVYVECRQGISHLDQIIVSTASRMTDRARTYLVPALYAYWERFFRLAFCEFVRSIDNAKLSVSDVNAQLARYRLTKELQRSLKRKKAQHLHELADRLAVADTKALFRALHDWFDAPIDFGDAEEWIDTRSNVKYETLEENCENLGIDVRVMKLAFEGSRTELYPGLKTLVDTRNDIAHGSEFHALTQDEWHTLREFVLALMHTVQDTLYETLRDKGKLLRT